MDFIQPLQSSGMVAQGSVQPVPCFSDGFARYACIILASAKHNVWESFVLAEGSAIDFPSLTPMFRATAGSYRLAAHSHKIRLFELRRGGGTGL
jgi:hypothetical protein